MGICPACGGVNGFSVTRIVDLINKDAPHPWAVACPGHAKPKHDGQLDKQNETEIRIDGRFVLIEDHYHCIVLEASQALSLLSWLEQEKATLEKMVGVEKDKAKG